MKHYVRLGYERTICPDCGTLEALETIMTGSPAPKSRWALPHTSSQPKAPKGGDSE